VLLVREGVTEPQPVLEIEDLVTEGPGELLALAVDPGFEDTGFLYALYTAAVSTGAPVFRIARFREAGGLFAQQVVILDDVAAATQGGAASLRFGPDGKLYAALGAGPDPRASGDLASFNGKVLRLNGDGTTPRDQPAASPVHAYPFKSPAGLAWHRPSGVLWIAEGSGAGGSRLTAVVADGGQGSPAPRSGHVLAGLAAPSALAVYEGDLLPMLRDNLLVASADGGSIQRLRVDPGDPARITGAERLLEDVPGGVRVVAVGSDGAIYFCTARTLARLAPADSTEGRQ
jgi:glucose/arabinose dehydrogenase